MKVGVECRLSKTVDQLLVVKWSTRSLNQKKHLPAPQQHSIIFLKATVQKCTVMNSIFNTYMSTTSLDVTYLIPLVESVFIQTLYSKRERAECLFSALQKFPKNGKVRIIVISLCRKKHDMLLEL